jgi:NADH-quinone oxidoreductase subunit C
MVKPAIEAIKEKFPDQVLDVKEHHGQFTVSVRRDKIVEILRMLRDEHRFSMLSDVCGLDYSTFAAGKAPERFAVAYQLYSFDGNRRLRVKAFIPESDVSIDSVSGLFKLANWAEREAWDMMGIRFQGHPDLRRILLPENYGSHPHRKEYPVTGKGERDSFPKYYE